MLGGKPSQLDGNGVVRVEREDFAVADAHGEGAAVTGGGLGSGCDPVGVEPALQALQQGFARPEAGPDAALDRAAQAITGLEEADAPRAGGGVGPGHLGVEPAYNAEAVEPHARDAVGAGDPGSAQAQAVAAEVDDASPQGPPVDVDGDVAAVGHPRGAAALQARAEGAGREGFGGHHRVLSHEVGFDSMIAAGRGCVGGVSIFFLRGGNRGRGRPTGQP